MRRRTSGAALLVVGALVAATLAGCTASADQNGDAVPGVIPPPSSSSCERMPRPSA